MIHYIANYANSPWSVVVELLCAGIYAMILIHSHKVHKRNEWQTKQIEELCDQILKYQKRRSSGLREDVDVK
jgi:hypothetical protein